MNSKFNLLIKGFALLGVVGLLSTCGGGGGSGGGSTPVLDDITRVSINANGDEANGDQIIAAISADGLHVGYLAVADNLVVGDGNGMEDVFVHNTTTNTITRVSVDNNGIEGNNHSGGPSVSSDGRYVAYGSLATNLIMGDGNGFADIFVRDTLNNTTSRISLNLSGGDSDGPSSIPSISANGQYVAFESTASDLVAGDTNLFSDVFVRDTISNVTTRVSVNGSGIQGNSASQIPSISADGRYVAFQSSATNLVVGDTTGFTDIFVRDTINGFTTRVSVDSNRIAGNTGSFLPSISGDGRYVAFQSTATNLDAGNHTLDSNPDIFVHDTSTGATIRASENGSGVEGDGSSRAASLSGDGRYVAFGSDATNLVAGDTNNRRDIFVRDIVTGVITRVSVDSSGTQNNGDEYRPAISADGLYVAFESSASDLVAGDINGVIDIFRAPNSP